jgi:hypothetical protein
MENKGVSAVKRQIGVINVQHNRLVTLVGCMYSEIEKLKNEINELKGNNGNQTKEINITKNPNPSAKLVSGNKSISELNANEILRQLNLNIESNDN